MSQIRRECPSDEELKKAVTKVLLTDPDMRFGVAVTMATRTRCMKKLEVRLYSLKPPLVLQTDNGPEFKIQFERALDKAVKVTHGPAYSSNSQGEVENANKIWRGVMRRLLHSQKAEPQQWSKFVPQANVLCGCVQGTPYW